MGIENIMYFALGLLVAGLLALIVMPAVWRRAVRLTKKRIEAATPITMAEFRADKDQLRAEFALSTRRLEMNVEALRRRLSEQLRDVNRKRTEVGAIKGERDNHLTQIRELEEREAELRRRILDLEKEGADLSQRLRMRDREYADKTAQLETAREALRGKTPRSIDVDGQREQLLAEKLAIEDELDRLRSKVLTVESTIMADWDSERIEQSHLREKLNDIASEVSRLVYAVEGEPADSDETLLQRVQKYSDETAMTAERIVESRLPEPVGQGSAVSDRLAALRDIQSRS